MSLSDYHLSLGAHLAQDGIPLHYGDRLAEYQAALTHSILLDRSHEGRLSLSGSDRLSLIDRMSTNAVAKLALHAGSATTFTNPTGRILDRVTVYQREDDLLMISEPGRGMAVANYIRSNIFFRDQVQLNDITNSTFQFAIHGPKADLLLEGLDSRLKGLLPLHGAPVQLLGHPIYAARSKPISGTHWILSGAAEIADQIHSYLLEAGRSYGLTAGGSLTYHTLRVRAGRPAGRELSSEYIPLEVGLWDEVSFNKGCYTGQEIIARMESRAKLARTIVTLKLSNYIESPAPIFHEQQQIGAMTSSAAAPDGEIFALAVLKTTFARPGASVFVGDEKLPAQIEALAGTQADFLTAPEKSIENG